MGPHKIRDGCSGTKGSVLYRFLTYRSPLSLVDLLHVIGGGFSSQWFPFLLVACLCWAVCLPGLCSRSLVSFSLPFSFFLFLFVFFWCFLFIKFDRVPSSLELLAETRVVHLCTFAIRVCTCLYCGQRTLGGRKGWPTTSPRNLRTQLIYKVREMKVRNNQGFLFQIPEVDPLARIPSIDQH